MNIHEIAADFSLYKHGPESNESDSVFYVDYTETITDFKAGVSYFEKVMLPGFMEWYLKLTPSQKCTVHPPAGSGGSPGIYELSASDLFTKFKTEKGY